jgi:hypothetical protein
MAFVRDKQRAPGTNGGGGGFVRDRKPGSDDSLFRLPDTSAPGYWGGVSQRAKDLARAAVSGVTFGLADKGAALADTLGNGMTWADANKKQHDLREASRADLDAVNPGTYAATEFGGSLLNPAVAGKFLAPEAGMFKSALGFGTEGAGKGALSAYTHDGSAEDIAMGAGIGGALGGLGGALAAPFAKWWSGGTRAAPPPPAPRTLQEVFQPPAQPPAPTSRVANTLDAVGNTPRLATVAADMFLGGPYATAVSGYAKSMAPMARDYFTKGADGRLLVNPQAAQEARDVLARLTTSAGAQR